MIIIGKVNGETVKAIFCTDCVVSAVAAFRMKYPTARDVFRLK